MLKEETQTVGAEKAKVLRNGSLHALKGDGVRGTKLVTGKRAGRLRSQCGAARYPAACKDETGGPLSSKKGGIGDK